VNWTVEDQVGDLPEAGWWFSVGACHVSADATVCPDTAGQDAWLFQTGDADVTKFFDEGFDLDLLPPATMANALIRLTHRAKAARDAYAARNRLADAIAAWDGPPSAGSTPTGKP